MGVRVAVVRSSGEEANWTRRAKARKLLLAASKLLHHAPTRPPFTRAATLNTTPRSVLRDRTRPLRSFFVLLSAARLKTARTTTSSRDPAVNGAGQSLAIVSPSAAGLPHTEAPRRGRRPVGALCNAPPLTVF
ncbi:hypothetical protein PMIN07_005219 [Paraphaeosphaeria minitans]